MGRFLGTSAGETVRRAHWRRPARFGSLLAAGAGLGDSVTRGAVPGDAVVGGEAQALERSSALTERRTPVARELANDDHQRFVGRFDAHTSPGIQGDVVEHQGKPNALGALGEVAAARRLGGAQHHPRRPTLLGQLETVGAVTVRAQPRTNGVGRERVRRGCTAKQRTEEPPPHRRASEHRRAARRRIEDARQRRLGR